MAESINNSIDNPGDDFQQRPTDAPDTQAEGQTEPINGQIELRFDPATGKPTRIHIIPPGEPHGKIKIIESQDEPGVYNGIITEYDGDEYIVVDDETTGEPVAIPNPNKHVSMYTRYDPERQQQGDGDAVDAPADDTAADADTQATGEPSARESMQQSPEAEAVVIATDATDDPDAELTPQDIKDAFSRRQDKSLEMMAQSLRENARMYDETIGKALRESSQWFKEFADVMTPAVQAAYKAATDAARVLTPVIQETARRTAQFARSLPTFDPEYMRMIGETLRKWGRENIILLTMVQQWDILNGGDVLEGDEIEEMTPLDDTEPTDTDDAAAPEADRAIDALRILAAAYSESHGGIDAIINDDGTSFDLPPEAEADIKRVIDEYSAFHNSSGAESFVYTANLFAKAHLQPTDPGAIVVRDRLQAISLRDFQFALTTRPNPTAFIAPLGTGMFTRFRYDEKSGQVINVKTRQPVQETQTPAQTASMMKTQADGVTTPDFVLLVLLYGILLDNATRFEGDNIIVPIKSLAKATGIDVSAGHAKDLEKKFALYDPYVGWINGHGLFAVLKFIKRDDVNGTITFSAPYLNRLLSIVTKQATRTYKSGRKTMLGHNDLVHATIYDERNQTAAAVVIAITNLLLQNRQQPDSKKGEKHVICHVAFSTLADYAELAPRIERIAATREKTRTLKACFTKALELLRTKSDAYQYYNGLELYTLGKDGKTKTFATVTGKDGKLSDNMTGGKEPTNAIAPTFAGYNSILYIRHRGANKNWKHDG